MGWTDEEALVLVYELSPGTVSRLSLTLDSTVDGFSLVSLLFQGRNH